MDSKGMTRFDEAAKDYQYFCKGLPTDQRLIEHLHGLFVKQGDENLPRLGEWARHRLPLPSLMEGVYEADKAFEGGQAAGGDADVKKKLSRTRAAIHIYLTTGRVCLDDELLDAVSVKCRRQDGNGHYTTTAKVDSRGGPDDAVYKKHPLLQELVPRGDSVGWSPARSCRASISREWSRADCPPRVAR